MATVTVRIPPPLRSFTNGMEAVDVKGATVSEVLVALSRDHGGIDERILQPDGDLRHFVNLFLGDQNVRELDGLKTVVRDGDTLSIIPAVAGGAHGREG